jgi:hypothetical protein
MLYKGGTIQPGFRNWVEGYPEEKSMSDLKDKVKDSVDAAAEAAKKAADVVTDKTKDAAHAAGKKMAEGAKKLKNA